jgi:hypothetical protein
MTKSWTDANMRATGSWLVVSRMGTIPAPDVQSTDITDAARIVVAQNTVTAERGVQVGGRKGTNRAGIGTLEIVYFKLYKIQIGVIEQAMETAALMLGTDKSRGYRLEMICADFLAGASLDDDESVDSLAIDVKAPQVSSG